MSRTRFTAVVELQDSQEQRPAWRTRGPTLEGARSGLVLPAFHRSRTLPKIRFEHDAHAAEVAIC